LRSLNLIVGENCSIVIEIFFFFQKDVKFIYGPPCFEFKMR